MVVLQWISTFLLVLVATTAVNYALFRHKRQGWFIALAFILYFFYAVFDLRPSRIPVAVTYVLFFLATVSMLWAVLSMFRERPPAPGSPEPDKTGPPTSPGPESDNAGGSGVVAAVHALDAHRDAGVRSVDHVPVAHVHAHVVDGTAEED